MSLFLGAVSIAILIALLALVRAGHSPPVAPHKRGVAVDTGHREPETPEVTAAPPLPASALEPDELAAFTLVATSDINPARRAMLLEEMERIFLPPRSLRELSSPEFFNSGNTRELSDFLMREPVLAARVLGVVNSPLHGLQSPIVSVQHAINYLGVNTVRSIAIRFLVEESYRTETPSLQPLYKRIWDAGLMGSEICTLLSQRLGFSDIGASATVTVLSFVGDFAALTLMPPETSLESWQHGLLERSRIQQGALGFSAMVAGDLLLQRWGLPPSVVSGIERAGTILVTPAPTPTGPDTLRLALCYLSARIGEGIAMGRITELDQISLSPDQRPELFHLQSYLAQPAFAKLPDILQSPEIRLALARMIAAATAHQTH